MIESSVSIKVGMDMNMKDLLQQLQEKKISPEQAMQQLKTMNLSEASIKEISEVMKKYRTNYKQKTSTKIDEVKNGGESKGAGTTEEKVHNAQQEGIAIIGMAGKYPGAKDMEEYWSMLVQGMDGISEIPKWRCDVDRLYDPEKQKEGHIYTKKMGAISDIDKFDSIFFEIAPSEADLMDPQQRVFLETGYTAFEDAGYCKENLSNTNCGVYLGMSHAGYDKNFGEEDSKSLIGSSSAVAASRISYFLNLKGPALAIDTACSSGLVCANIAVHALQNKEIDMALVGGSSIYLDENAFIGMCEAGMLSEEGISRPFDENADGIVVSDGVGAIVLKRLEDAIKDHDHIYGVIVGSGMNQDGKTNGITAPNLNSQKALIEEVYQENAIDAKDISYVEMHGTGTKLGDPIELEAIGSVYQEVVKARNSCAIGSVKSNLGHTSAASGIAGLQKILLCMQHKTLVPTIHLQKLNERFDFEHSPFYVNQEVKDWATKDGKPRMAAVSSFGFSGTNAHMVVKEYAASNEPRLYQAKKGPRNVFLLTAKTKQSLKEYVLRIITYLKNNKESLDFTSFLYTYQCRREHLKERLAILVDSSEDLLNQLKQYVERGEDQHTIYEGTADRNLKIKKAFDRKDLQHKTATEVVQAWLQGKYIDWLALYTDEMPYVVSAPTYPFEKATHWITKKHVANSSVQQVLHPLLHQNISRLDCQEFSTVFTSEEELVTEHRLNGQPVLPGTAILEMVLVAGQQSLSGTICEIRDIVWLKPIPIEAGTKVVTSLMFSEDNTVDFEIYRVPSDNEEEYELCAQGSLVFETSDVTREVKTFDELAFQSACTHKLTGRDLYQRADKPLTYGKHYQTIESIDSCEDKAIAIVKSKQGEWSELYQLNPYLMDGILQTIAVFLHGTKQDATVLPFSIKALKLYQKLSEEVVVAIEPIKKNTAMNTFHLLVMDKAGTVLMEVEDFSVKEISMAVEEPKSSQNGQKEERQISEVSQEDADLMKKAEELIKEVLVEKIRIPLERIDSSESFEAYGIDSILVVSIARELEKTFGKLSKTLMFEYPSIQAMAQYLLEEKREVLNRLCEKQESKDANQALSNERNNVSNQMMKKGRSSFAKGSFVRNHSDIAIIGMSGKYPMADDMEQFWRNLEEGLDCIIEIPSDRWEKEEYYDEKKGTLGKTNSKWGGFLEDAYCFDSLFFNMSPSEAEFTDPQIRVFLETAWHAMEDAGYTRDSLSHHKVGVYAGVMYALYHLVETNMKGATVAGLTSFSMVANRISYFMNLHGPSISLDTMCSSSLTAIHLACQSILNGEIDMAFAGGVNIVTHPRKYVQLSQNNFMSSDGRCRSFGEGGDGYVPGEGSGCVILKSLEAAKRDHDHIYAVIKASSINAGGKAAGFTVPNMEAQAELIQDALKQSGIHPRTIGYYEAHGTGTSLGDPIEIKGMTKAYRSYTMDRQFCPVGSVKSNIGHLESAAGMASLMKVILQMKHQKLVPSIHTEHLNPNIEFEETPFYVQRDLEEWKPMVLTENGQEVSYPRRAAISAFGAGGSNSHLIVEEYVEEPSTTEEKEARLFILSAKNVARLEEYIQRIILWLENTKESWADMIYTFQIGREAMEERIAIIAESKEQLLERLKQYVRTEQTNEIVYRGNILDVVDKTTNAATIADYLQQKDWENLAKLWVDGTTIDWNQLYTKEEVYKISLPVYPFARVYHFLKEKEDVHFEESTIQATGILHPMVHSNQSNRKGWSFTSTFTGKESFLKDHVLNNEEVLPGAAYLEMVTYAMQSVFGDWNQLEYSIQIRDVVWLRPYVYSKENKSLTLTMTAKDENLLAFEVYSMESEEKVIHCQGSIGVVYKTGDLKECDIDAITLRCDREELIGEACYEVFHILGLDYGEGQRCLKKINVGEGEILAELEVSKQCVNSISKYTLHPGLVDSAFQATIGLHFEGEMEEGQKAALPFAIDQMLVDGTCTSKMWAHISTSKAQKNSSSLRNVDIVFVNDQKQIVCKMKKVSFRAMKQDTAVKVPVIQKKALILTNVWKQEQGYTVESSINVETIVFAYDVPKEELAHGERWVELCTKETSTAAQYKELASQLFENLQTVVKEYRGKKLSLVLLLGYTKETQSLLGLSSLMKTVQTEHSNVSCRTIGLLGENSVQADASVIRKELEKEREDLILYQGMQRFVQRLEEVEPLTGTSEVWKQNGVYLISGGTGALGLLTAENIIQTTPSAICILLGRSKPKDSVQKSMDRMNQKKEHVFYVCADVTNLEQLKAAVNEICNRFGKLDGVIHCSGIIRDRLMIHKNLEEFQRVLDPKVLGVANLDEATKQCHLDLFVIYSSLASIIGNMGQCDYACANGFMDFFADSRNHMVAKGSRYGRTISINWPLWKQGSMHVDEETEAYARQSIGLETLSNETGLELLHKVLKGDANHTIPLPGDVSKLKETFLGKKQEREIVILEKRLDTKKEDSMQQARNDVMKACMDIFGDNMKLDAADIDERIPFEDYGIDSVRVINITNELERVYGTLPKTLLYECKNLRELVEYILENKGKELMSLEHKEMPSKPTNKLTHKEQEESEQTNPVQKAIENEDLESYQWVPLNQKADIERSQSQSEEDSRDDIAIIGVSGRYPMAENLSEFWDNLKKGRDCISEIPKNRWDYESYFSTQKGEYGKMNTKWGGFIENAEMFDSLFFKISPAEADFMDPQLRVFIETAWHTLEDAGYTPESLSQEMVGVFAGVMYSSYEQCNAKMNGVTIPFGVYHASIPNRVSYLLDFKGPSIAVDTVCSSSLTALHLACESIKRGESSVALVGGVNLTLHPNKMIVLSQNKFMSAEGKCRSFGEGGDGYVPGEGCGALLIKPLKNAIKDHDHIYAVIKGTAVSGSGRTNGFRVPSPVAQARVIRAAYKNAGISPTTIGYIEAHGTGTKLGDPIEIEGLNRVFDEEPEKNEYCSIGSVKSNIGHLEAAAGIAAITKVLLQMKYKELVPSLHSKEINQLIDFEHSVFQVQQTCEPWSRKVIVTTSGQKEIPLRAGISAFGAGGCNAHVVLEEYTEDRSKVEEEQTPQVILLSAKNKDRLQEYVREMLTYLEAETKEQTQKETKEKILELLVQTVIELTPFTESMDFMDLTFEELGFDEYMYSRLNEALEAKLKIQLEETLFYQYQTPQRLAMHLAEEMSARNQTERGALTSIKDMAYTLQCGRVELEERIAVVVTSVEELSNALNDYLQGNTKNPSIHTGNIAHKTKEQESLLKLINDPAVIEKMVQEQNLEQLAELWAHGVTIPWSEVFDDTRRSKLSLPGYPFERETHWLTGYDDGSVKADPEAITIQAKKDWIHPLVQKNTSNFSGMRFESSLTGTETYLMNHVVQTKKMLPAVAYLEMVRAALFYLMQIEQEDLYAVKLENVMIQKPLVVEQQEENYEIICDAVKENELTFRVKNREEAVAYCTGKGALVSSKVVGPADLNQLEAKLSDPWMKKGDFYSLFQTIGIEYGKPYQCVEKISKEPQLLIAKLVENEPTQQGYYYNLGMMDSALQLAMAYFMPMEVVPLGKQDDIEQIKTKIPVSFGQIELCRPFTKQMWVVVTETKPSGQSSRFTKLNLVMYDEEGNVSIRFKDVIYMEYQQPEMIQKVKPTLITKSGHTIDHTMFLIPQWSSQPKNRTALHVDHWLTILCGKGKYHLELMETSGIEKVYEIGSAQEVESMAYIECANKLFTLIKQLIKENKGKIFLQLVVELDQSRPAFRGLSAMVKSLAQEYPRFTCQVIDVDHMPESPALIKLLEHGKEYASSDCIRSLRGQLTYGSLELVELTETDQVPWREDGVYVLFGGTGELGWRLAKEIVQTTKNAHLILSARSECKETIIDRMNQLRSSCASIEYERADVTKESEVHALVDKVVQTYGTIHGVVFLSGIVRDHFIVQKSEEEFESVLETKVKGIYNVDQATRQLPLDFFLMYSSLSGVLGNAGQCDYATANAYLDAFAVAREAWREEGTRFGQTISMNWPLCANGGMGNDETLAATLKRNLGIVPMSEDNMMKCLKASMQSGYRQVIPLEGDCNQIASILLGKTEEAQTETTQAETTHAETISKEELISRFEHYLKRLVSPVIKLDATRIDAGVKLEDYGIDSVVIMRLTERLEEDFKELPQTLFFENQTIHQLSEYLCSKYEGKVKELLYIKEVPKDNGSCAVIKSTKPVTMTLPTMKLAQTIRKEPVASVNVDDRDEIAIIGVAGMYPQADNLEEFWGNLIDGKDCITEIPKERWDCEKYYDQNPGMKNKTNAKWGGFINHPENFDPLFFHISPREAAAIDPQERLFLQCVYHAIEDAGYTKDTLATKTAYGMNNNVGVFVGVMYEEYQLYAAMQQAAGNMITLGASEASIANRVSYYCGFHGPSMALDSMCSSSLVTIHLACKSILDGECEAAVAGGVNLSIHPNKFFMLGQNGFAASDGRCRSFGKGGTGYTPGEGVGALILKRKSQAIADGDHIYGIVKGSAVNHGGKVNGYSVPNPQAQTSVIQQAMFRANLRPDEIDYIEAHGTGTALGDPIEIESLEQAFAGCTKKIPIGSVKSNIGHCEGAAGIAAITKVLLQMKYQLLVPSLHSKELNPKIDFERSHFEVVRSLMNWKTRENKPLHAGISAFGAGGTNAHIILESYCTEDEPTVETERPLMFVFSARKAEQLNQEVRNMLQWLEHRNITYQDLRNIAYTLQVGREEMEERVGIIASNLHEFREKLAGFLEGKGDYYLGKVNNMNTSMQTFCEDEDGKDILMKWYEGGKYYKILEFWVQGISVPWRDFTDETIPRRISLPGYPFEQVKCWGVTLDERDHSPVIETVQRQNTARQGMEKYSMGKQEELQSTKSIQLNQNETKTSESSELYGAMKQKKQEHERKENLVRKICEFLSEELMIPMEEIEIHKSFGDFGVNSLTGMKLVDMIMEQYGLEISPTEIYDYTSISLFADFLTEEIQKLHPMETTEESTQLEESMQPEEKIQTEKGVQTGEKERFEQEVQAKEIVQKLQENETDPTMKQESKTLDDNQIDHLFQQIYEGHMEVEDAKRLLFKD